MQDVAWKSKGESAQDSDLFTVALTPYKCTLPRCLKLRAIRLYAAESWSRSSGRTSCTVVPRDPEVTTTWP